METVNIYEAKTKLSQLVDRAAAGEDVVVSRNGKPLVRITRLDVPKRRIRGDRETARTLMALLPPPVQ